MAESVAKAAGFFWYKWQYPNGKFCGPCGCGYLDVESIVELHGDEKGRIVTLGGCD